MKSLLTWTKRRLLQLFRKLSTRQNFHILAEMFSFHSKYFVYRPLKRAPQKLSFCFQWPHTGTGRILGNIQYSSFMGMVIMNLALWTCCTPTLPPEKAGVKHPYPHPPQRPPLHKGYFLLSPRWPLWRGSPAVSGICPSQWLWSWNVVDNDGHFDSLCGSHAVRVKVICITSFDAIKLWFLTWFVD